MSTNPVFLAIGHVTTDLIGGRPIPGGAALYAAVQARALGLSVRLLTATAEGWPGRPLLAGVEAKIVAAAEATTFDYAPGTGARRVRLVARASPLGPADLPEAWVRSDIALLGPVFHDVDPALSSVLRPRVLGLAPQGWMRRVAADSRVETSPWDPPAPLLQRADAIFFSEEDAEDADALAAWIAERARHAVVTRGARGATVWTEGRRIEVPAFPAREVDPTGAGDVFAAAFLVALEEGADPAEAGGFAAAAAAFAVEAPGVAGVRGRNEIELRRRVPR